MSKRNVVVKICDRPYQLMVKDDADEEIIREAAKKINDACASYAKNYAYQDQRDLISMAAISFAVSSLKREKIAHFRDHDLVNRLLQLNQALD